MSSFVLKREDTMEATVPYPFPNACLKPFLYSLISKRNSFPLVVKDFPSKKCLSKYLLLTNFS